MNDEKSIIYVSSRHLGLIIGKGGSRIKELSDECGCKINIKKDQAVDDEVPVHLEGSLKNIGKAKLKIDEITRRQFKRHLNDNDNHYDNGNDKVFSANNNSNKRQSRNKRSDDDDDWESSWKRKSSNDSYEDRYNDKDKFRNYNSRNDDSNKDSNSFSYKSSENKRDYSYNSKPNGNSRDYNSNSSYNDRNGYSYGTNSFNSNTKDKNFQASSGNGDDWGAWGKKNEEVSTVDSLIFNSNEPLLKSTKVNTPMETYTPDDDWGIPTYLEEEKPVRKRPNNAQVKLKSQKDSNFYPVHRNFYHEHPNVSRMSVEEKDKFLLAKNNIMIKEVESETGSSFCNFGNTVFEKDPEELIEEIPIPTSIPNPIRNFDESFFNHPDILKEIRKQKFDEPSPIQCVAWPILMTGRDFIGIAQTGTGKTLAFLLPAFIHIEGQPKPREKRQGPTVLILSPTRELAIQIQNEVQKYTYHDIDSVVCYGGADKREQIFQLKENPEIVVGTPGRIQDLKDSGALNLKDVSYLVLDEADRMLDMGFEIQVVNLIYAVRRQRQTVMTSATWPFGVQRIALTHMKNPVQVNVGTLDLNACHTVRQYVEYVEYHDKTQRLIEILSEIKPEDKIIIFVARKAQCSDLAFDLYLKRSKGQLGPKGAVRACEIHGDLDQQEREMALKMMRSGARNVMIATDVASRGLDIVDLTKVINYDFPKNIEEYVHRVGRTGRAGRTGEAFTFMNRNDQNNAAELIRILEDADQEVPDFIPQLMKQHQEFRISGGRGRFGGRGRGGGYGGDRGNRDRDNGGRRGGGGGGGGSNNFNRNRFDDMDSEVQTDSSWGNQDSSQSMDVIISSTLKRTSKYYMQDDMSDDDNWGTWNDEIKVIKELNEEKVEVTEIKMESLPKVPIKVSEVNNRFSAKPHLLGNKDTNIYPIHRNFYEEHQEISKLSFEEVESFLLRRNNIMIKELKTYPTQLSNLTEEANDDFDEDKVEILPAAPGIRKPIRTFEEMFWKHPDILKVIESFKFENPSPIQCIGWPVILSGRDFIGIAQTGTGKTLTFVLPALIHIEGQVKPRQYRQGPTVLILSPTRELAMQIECEILKIKYRDIKSACCYGGAEKANQINALRENPEIIVGTPGRLNDLIGMGYLCLNDVSYLVLDEADRMLDMGFEPQVINIIDRTRKQRQSIMTSATWPECVRQIALMYMDNPVQVNVGSLDLVACTDVVQVVRYVANSDKTQELCDILLEMTEQDKIIVFLTRKVQCRTLTKYLDRLVRSDKLGAYANICEIHGDLSQEEREQSLSWFREGYCTVLIATNVASRGLDIADITCVVNYDFPKDIEEYVHRVGRTGRAGKVGRSVTFINEIDSKHVYELRNILIQSNQQVPPWLLNIRSMKFSEQNKVNIGFNTGFSESTANYIDKMKNIFNNYESCDDDNDYYGESDFFDDYQRKCDIQIKTEDIPLGNCETLPETQNKPIETITNKQIVEVKVIEYHSDLYSELCNEYDENEFFDGYQKNIENHTEDNSYDMNLGEEIQYESDDHFEAWW